MKLGWELGRGEQRRGGGEKFTDISLEELTRRRSLTIARGQTSGPRNRLALHVRFIGSRRLFPNRLGISLFCQTAALYGRLECSLIHEQDLRLAIWFRLGIYIKPPRR